MERVVSKDKERSEGFSQRSPKRFKNQSVSDEEEEEEEEHLVNHEGSENEDELAENDAGVASENLPVETSEEKIGLKEDEKHCVCQQNFNEGDLMIQCEQCQGWFHPRCVGLASMNQEALDSLRFVCPSCKPASKLHASLPSSVASAPSHHNNGDAAPQGLSQRPDASLAAMETQLKQALEQVVHQQQYLNAVFQQQQQQMMVSLQHQGIDPQQISMYQAQANQQYLASHKALVTQQHAIQQQLVALNKNVPKEPVPPSLPTSTATTITNPTLPPSISSAPSPLHQPMPSAPPHPPPPTLPTHSGSTPSPSLTQAHPSHMNGEGAPDPSRPEQMMLAPPGLGLPPGTQLSAQQMYELQMAQQQQQQQMYYYYMMMQQQQMRALQYQHMLQQQQQHPGSSTASSSAMTMPGMPGMMMPGMYPYMVPGASGVPMGYPGMMPGATKTDPEQSAAPSMMDQMAMYMQNPQMQAQLQQQQYMQMMAQQQMYQRQLIQQQQLMQQQQQMQQQQLQHGQHAHPSEEKRSQGGHKMGPKSVGATSAKYTSTNEKEIKTPPKAFPVLVNPFTVQYPGSPRGNKGPGALNTNPTNALQPLPSIGLGTIAPVGPALPRHPSSSDLDQSPGRARGCPPSSTKAYKNQQEKQRRSSLRKDFNKLSSVIPDDCYSSTVVYSYSKKRPGNADVLTCAKKYIDSLVNDEAHLNDTVSQLRTENAYLRQLLGAKSQMFPEIPVSSPLSLSEAWVRDHADVSESVPDSDEDGEDDEYYDEDYSDEDVDNESIAEPRALDMSQEMTPRASRDPSSSHPQDIHSSMPEEDVGEHKIKRPNESELPSALDHERKPASSTTHNVPHVASPSPVSIQNAHESEDSDEESRLEIVQEDEDDDETS